MVAGAGSRVRSGISTLRRKVEIPDLTLLPGVNIDVRPRAELRRPALDFLLQAGRLQQGPNLVLYLGKRRNRQAARASLLAPGRPVVVLDLVGRDKDHRREALLNLKQPRFNRVLRHILGPEPLDVAKPQSLRDQRIENILAIVVLAPGGGSWKEVDLDHLGDLADGQDLPVDDGGDPVDRCRAEGEGDKEEKGREY